MMRKPSPIHRDPTTDGDDYGCIGRTAKKGNRAVAELVESIKRDLHLRCLADGSELIEQVRLHLEEIDRRYDCGACDTIVKENVLFALADAIADAGLSDFSPMQIYGW
ncbi:MAG TPA: hypothetical protein VGG19_04035 [Tepidisphaeraceae bacterium]|jgi:hypothetical protein